MTRAGQRAIVILAAMLVVLAGLYVLLAYQQSRAAEPPSIEDLNRQHLTRQARYRAGKRAS